MRLNNATIKQVIVSPVTLGERLRLCGIRPYNEYIDADTYLSFGKSYLGSQISNFDGAKKVNVTVVINGQTLSQTVDIQNY